MGSTSCPGCRHPADRSVLRAGGGQGWGAGGPEQAGRDEPVPRLGSPQGGARASGSGVPPPAVAPTPSGSTRCSIKRPPPAPPSGPEQRRPAKQQPGTRPGKDAASEGSLAPQRGGHATARDTQKHVHGHVAFPQLHPLRPDSWQRPSLQGGLRAATPVACGVPTAPCGDLHSSRLQVMRRVFQEPANRHRVVLFLLHSVSHGCRVGATALPVATRVPRGQMALGDRRDPQHGHRTRMTSAGSTRAWTRRAVGPPASNATVEATVSSRAELAAQPQRCTRPEGTGGLSSGCVNSHPVMRVLPSVIREARASGPQHG